MCDYLAQYNFMCRTVSLSVLFVCTRDMFSRCKMQSVIINIYLRDNERITIRDNMVQNCKQWLSPNILFYAYACTFHLFSKEMSSIL